MINWISIKDEPPPIGRSFLAAWVDPEGYIDGVEWYSYDGYNYWNQNSGNLNEFSGKNQLPLFTYWVLFEAYIK